LVKATGDAFSPWQRSKPSASGLRIVHEFNTLACVQGHVKMNAFFYDYDDFDHTTALVDWFETELSGHGALRQQTVSGNRQKDKTRFDIYWTNFFNINIPPAVETGKRIKQG
jgi:hypothetical protein